MIRTTLPRDAQAIHNLHTRPVRGLCSHDYTTEVIDAWLAGRAWMWLAMRLAFQVYEDTRVWQSERAAHES